METDTPNQLVLFPDRDGRQTDATTTVAKQAHKGDPGKDARAGKARTSKHTNNDRDAPTPEQVRHWQSPVRLSQEALEAVLKLRRRQPQMTARANSRSHKVRE